MILALDKLWINRLDTGEAIAAASSPTDRGQVFSKQVDVREYANGRLRSYSTGVASRGQLTYRLMAIDYATKEMLISWAGLAVQIRDYRGQKWHGTFADVDVTEYEQPGLYTAGFTLRTITVVEGV